MLRERIEKLEQAIAIDEIKRDNKLQMMQLNPEIIRNFPKKAHYKKQGVYYGEDDSDESESSDNDDETGESDESEDSSDSDDSGTGDEYGPRFHTP